MRLQFLRTLI